MLELKTPPAVDYEKLREEIHTHNNECLAILDETSEDILTDDFEEDCRINYHLCKPTDEWLRSRFLWTANCQKDKERWEDAMVRCLLSSFLPPEMFVVLNRIIAVRTLDDYHEVCKVMDVENCEFPDILDPDEPGPLGVKWHTQNSIILDFNGIDAALHELAQEVGGGDIRDEEEGVLITLLHEMRHLMLDNNPFDIFAESPHVEDFTEYAVEDWARRMFEAFRISRVGKQIKQLL